MGILNDDTNDTPPLAVVVQSFSSLMSKGKGQERISIPSSCGSSTSTATTSAASSSSVSTTTTTSTTKALSSASSMKSTTSTLTAASTSTSSLLSSLHSSRNSSSSSLSSFLTSITSATTATTTTATSTSIASAITTSAIATQTTATKTVTVTETVEKILPPVIWLEHIIPLLDRQGWNVLMNASKHLYLLVQLTNIPNSSYSKVVAQPPWPTNYCFAPTGSSSQQAMDSFTLSYDGDYLACGSAIGTIELWNRRTGKVRLRKAPSTSLTGNNSTRVRVSRSTRKEDERDEEEQQGSITPVGNILKFSPIDYTLACGHENRIVLWDISQIKSISSKAKVTGRTSTTTKTKHHHYLPTPSVLPTYSNNLKQHQQQQQQSRQQQEPGESYTQTLEINCHRQGSNLYEITYINFSQDASRILARYGKMAYLWTRTTTQSYQLTHQIVLTSSRCQIVSNPSLSFLAVASNNGSALASTTTTTTTTTVPRGSAGYTANDEAAVVNMNDSSNNNNNTNNNSRDCHRTSVRTTATGKGIIHVWDLSTTTASITNEDDNDVGIPTQHNDGSTKIIAYPTHVVRGLEFISSSSSMNTNNDNDSNNNSSSNSCCLVSGSLQGELKFWLIKNTDQTKTRKYYTYGNNSNNNNEKQKEENNKLEYICLYSFQSPGKIFSLSSWSSSNNNNHSKSSSLLLSSSFYRQHSTDDEDDGCDIYLAAGEARGQLWIWNVNVTRKQYQHNQGERNHEQREQERERNHKQSSSSSSIDNSNNDSGGSSSLLFPRRNRPSIRLQEVLVKEVGEHVHYDNLKLVSFVPSSSLSNTNNHHDRNAMSTCSSDKKNDNPNTAVVDYYYNYYAGNNNGNAKKSSTYSNQYNYTPPSQPPRSIAVSRSYDSRIYFQSIPF